METSSRLVETSSRLVDALESEVNCVSFEVARSVDEKHNTIVQRSRDLRRDSSVRLGGKADHGSTAQRGATCWRPAGKSGTPECI